MKDRSALFNALPDDMRAVVRAMEARTRIQQLQFEKERLKAACDKSVKFIDGMIKTNEAWLLNLENKLP